MSGGMFRPFLITLWNTGLFLLLLTAVSLGFVLSSQWETYPESGLCGPLVLAMENDSLCVFNSSAVTKADSHALLFPLHTVMLMIPRVTSQVLLDQTKQRQTRWTHHHARLLRHFLTRPKEATYPGSYINLLFVCFKQDFNKSVPVLWMISFVLQS